MRRTEHSEENTGLCQAPQAPLPGVEGWTGAFGEEDAVELSDDYAVKP